MRGPSIRTWRRTIQVGVAAAFIAIPYLNNPLRINILYGNFLCFNAAGLPLADPLAVLQVALKNGQPSLRLFIGAGIALTLAMVLGTVFCSWICPFGLLSEGAHALSHRLPRWKPGSSAVQARRFGLKAALFTLGLVYFLSFATTPVLNQLSMPAWYSRIFQFLFVQRHLSLAILVILAVLSVELLAGRRLWCRHVCPQSFLLVLAKRLNPARLKVDWQESRCTCKGERRPCEQACSLSLAPRALARATEAECTNCGDCIVACQKMGRALTFRFGLRVAGCQLRVGTSRPRGH